MLLGKQLSKDEKCRVDALASQKTSTRHIAKEMLKREQRQSHSVVSNSLKDKEGYEEWRKQRPKQKLTFKDKRSLFRYASNST